MTESLVPDAAAKLPLSPKPAPSEPARPPIDKLGSIPKVESSAKPSSATEPPKPPVDVGPLTLSSGGTTLPASGGRTRQTAIVASALFSLIAGIAGLRLIMPAGEDTKQAKAPSQELPSDPKSGAGQTQAPTLKQGPETDSTMPKIPLDGSPSKVDPTSIKTSPAGDKLDNTKGQGAYNQQTGSGQKSGDSAVPSPFPGFPNSAIQSPGATPPNVVPNGFGPTSPGKNAGEGVAVGDSALSPLMPLGPKGGPTPAPASGTPPPQPLGANFPPVGPSGFTPPTSGSLPPATGNPLVPITGPGVPPTPNFNAPPPATGVLPTPLPSNPLQSTPNASLPAPNFGGLAIPPAPNMSLPSPSPNPGTPLPAPVVAIDPRDPFGPVDSHKRERENPNSRSPGTGQTSNPPLPPIPSPYDSKVINVGGLQASPNPPVPVPTNPMLPALPAAPATSNLPAIPGQPIPSGATPATPPTNPVAGLQPTPPVGGTPSLPSMAPNLPPIQPNSTPAANAGFGVPPIPAPSSVIPSTVPPVPTVLPDFSTGSAGSNTKPPPVPAFPALERPSPTSPSANVGQSVPPQPPASVPSPPAPRREPSPTTSYDVDLYEIKPTDSYESISQEFYNDKRYAAALKAANGNKPLSGGWIEIPPIYILKQKNQNRPANGTSISAHPTPPPSPPSPNWTYSTGTSPASSGPGSKTYKVPPGGATLTSIAKEVLGDGQKWQEIYNLNGWIKPDALLPEGTAVLVPANAKLPAN